MKNKLKFLIITGLLVTTTDFVLAEKPESISEPASKSETTDAHAEDNSAKNAEDKHMETALPEDQSEKAQYIERTANIRNAVVKMDVSTSAKNIKIITLDSGDVVLRGPVSSTAEKSKIEELAYKIASPAKVKSLLVVAQ